MLRTWVCRVIPPDDVDCGSMPIGWQAGGPGVANALDRTARTLSIGRAPRITLLDPRAIEMVAPDTAPCAVAHGPLTGACGQPPLGDKPIPLEFVGNPPQLSIDSLYPCNVGLGSSSVLRVRRSDPCLTLRFPRSGAQAAMQPTPGLSFEGRLLAGGASACFSEAAFARPIATKTRCLDHLIS